MAQKSFEDLPFPLLSTIVGYLDDPRSIGALEETSSTLQCIVKESDTWHRLYQERWTTTTTKNSNVPLSDEPQTLPAMAATPPQQPNNTTSPVTWWKSEYKRRHALDSTMQHCIDELFEEQTSREQVARAAEQVMSFQRDAMDLCWKTWLLYQQKNSSETNNTTNTTTTTGTDETSRNDAENDNNCSLTDRKAIISFCLLRSVHCSVVFQDIQDLCSGDENNEDNNNNNNDDDLEDYVIASSRMFFDVSKEGLNDTTSAWIRQELDHVAKLVQDRIASLAALAATNGATTSNDDDTETLQLKQKMNVLNTVLFDELNFKGNTDNYYDFDNSMLHKALQRRTGIPMTLAIVYKCIARRIGIHVDIIGLPGHIVIGVPALELYVDVFRPGRRFLTIADCRDIVHSYGYVMSPEFIQPLSPVQVFRRILNNCANCLSQTFPPNASKRIAVEAMRAVLINPTDDQVRACQRWFCQILWGSHSTAILREMCSW